MPFFLLVLGLSIPLWILGPIVGGELLPGLPVSALQFLCPVTAASLLLYRQSGAAGVAAFLKRSFDFRRITDPGRYVMAFLLIPATYRWIDRQGNRRMAFGAGRSSAACRSRAVSDGVRPLTSASSDAYPPKCANCLKT